ncbi:aspartate semialdehyde dehydrogenase [Bryocella elongata]|uniref:aspartate-semialdehyde dehydrogenase n=1 Tax=Bryocella elongata TaxID=863522 RepID=A0A1H5S6G4_9BACT|nr:aspartate-semialdehyde dehydrogenase [Bryocella elongata]SEF46233.1 aspartate semialdehyde dehydrogenase [Bryocella elongata]
MERRNVGILGATGAVGQRFIQLLADHPWFNITWLAASDRSAGKTYAEACAWRLDTPLPERIANMVLQPNTPEAAGDSLPRIIFSSIDAPIAKELEPRFAAAGCAVISNSSAFRMGTDVPLVVPEVNFGHFEVLESQQTRKSSGGFLVTNPNCCAIGLVLPLAALQARFGIDKLFVATMQAVSGAGYPGVPSLDILGNVIPFIKNEEEKLQEEVGKLLGGVHLHGDAAIGFEAAPITVSAMCNRVPVLEGHTECVSVKLKTPANEAEILAAWAEFEPLAGKNPQSIFAGMHLPSAPAQPVAYEAGTTRPQPRLDLMRGNGMATTVGRLRPCTLFDWKFTLLSHNTVRGAAGAAILNAEILAVLGKFDFRKFPPVNSNASAAEGLVNA